MQVSKKKVNQNLVKQIRLLFWQTISDLNGGAELLCKTDIAEALSYRRIALN